MPDVHFDRVEARVAEHRRTMRILLDDRGDVVGAHGPSAAHPEWGEHPRRRDGRRLRPHRIRDGARVADLRGHGRALGVHRVGELAQPGADFRVVEHDLMTVGAPGPGDRAVRHRRHAHTSRGERAVEFDELGRDDAPGRAALEGRGLDDPVPQLNRAEAGWGEGVGAHHARTVLSTRHNDPVDIEDFYSADPRRRQSEELEFGSDWHEGGARTQVSWVEVTGELYAMRDPLGHLETELFGEESVDKVTDEDLGVEVLGTVTGRDAVEAVMSGWEAAMPNGADSLAWVRDRVANAASELNDPPAAPSRDLP